MTAALNSADVLALIIKCVDFAAVKHVYQRRKDPERTPYINHPIDRACSRIQSWCKADKVSRQAV